MKQKNRFGQHTLQQIKKDIDPPTLTIFCGSLIRMDNCKGILQYTPEILEIDMGQLRVQIKGENMVLQHLRKGAMGVMGRPESVFFIYGE